MKPTFIAETRPYLRFDTKYKRLYISRTTIDILGKKPYVQFLWNEKTHTLLVAGLDVKVRDSFAVEFTSTPNASGIWNECMFYKKAFMDAIILRMKWDIGVSYKVFGHFAPGIGMAVFKLDGATVISEEVEDVGGSGGSDNG